MCRRLIMLATGSISMQVAGLWMLNIVLDTGGQLAFKAAAGDPNAGDGFARWKYRALRPWLWLGIGCYVVEFLVWVAFLSLIPLSKGVLLGSINTVAIMVAGRFLFGEKLTRLRVIGILLVTLGVVIVGSGG
jgi:drug/metabolite transporter (DMT)-like permease